MGEVKLIGSNHFDPKSERRRNALEREQPTILTQELSSEDDYQSLVRLFRKIVNGKHMPQAAKRMLDARGQKTYRRLRKGALDELVIPRKFASDHDIEMHYIDKPAMAEHRSQAGKIGAKIEEELLKAIAVKSYEEIVEEIENFYATLAALMRKTPRKQAGFFGPGFDSLFPDDRDEYPAQRIAELAAGQRGKLVHICGGAHLLDDSKKRTLYSKLRSRKGITVSRALLNEYD